MCIYICIYIAITKHTAPKQTLAQGPSDLNWAVMGFSTNILRNPQEYYDYDV